MKKRIVRMLGAGALFAAMVPLTACATPYGYGDQVHTSVTYTNAAPIGYWSHGRYVSAPRYYAPPRFHSPQAYSHWYWSQPYAWRKHNPYHWDGGHDARNGHDRDGWRDDGRHDGRWDRD